MTGASDLAWIFTVIRSSQNVELTGNHCVISDTLFLGLHFFDSDIIREKNPSLIITKMQIIIKTANFNDAYEVPNAVLSMCVYICVNFVYMYVIIHLILIMGIAFHILFKKSFSTPKVPKISFIFF